MDMMAIRRMVIAQMASGAEFIKGTFTVPSSGSSYTLEFGKTFNKYLYFFEMTDASKTALLGISATGARTFFVDGIYPNRAVNGAEIGDVFTYRVVPSTGVLSASYTVTIINECSSTSMTLKTGGTGNTSVFYNGYSYNYYIVEIK